jgi:flagellar assembly protein FliH
MAAHSAQAAFEPIFPGQSAAAGVASGGRRRAPLSEADVEAARAEGHAAGLREAMAQTERAAAEAERAIARLLQMSLGTLNAEAQSLRADAVAVALHAARQLAGRALSLHGEEAVVETFEAAAEHLRDQPRIVVRVAPALVEVLEARLQAVAAEAGVGGQVVVRGDAAAGLGDCALEWAGGSIHRDRDAAFAAIEAAAENWLAAGQAEGLQLDLFAQGAAR